MPTSYRRLMTIFVLHDGRYRYKNKAENPQQFLTAKIYIGANSFINASSEIVSKSENFYHLAVLYIIM